MSDSLAYIGWILKINNVTLPSTAFFSSIYTRRLIRLLSVFLCPPHLPSINSVSVKFSKISFLSICLRIYQLSFTDSKNNCLFCLHILLKGFHVAHMDFTEFFCRTISFFPHISSSSVRKVPSIHYHIEALILHSIPVFVSLFVRNFSCF